MLASRHDPSSPREAHEDGVRVVRVPVAFRPGKGVVMPTHGRLAAKLLRENDVLSLHVPQFEAGSLALRARLVKRPTVMTYHCDLQLPAGAVNRAVDRVMATSNHVAARVADRIVAYTDDYAKSVPLLRRFRQKVEIVPPPVVMPCSRAGCGRRVQADLGARPRRCVARHRHGGALRHGEGNRRAPRCHCRCSSSAFRAFAFSSRDHTRAFPARRPTAPGSSRRSAGSAIAGASSGRSIPFRRCPRFSGRSTAWSSPA